MLKTSGSHNVKLHINIQINTAKIIVKKRSWWIGVPQRNKNAQERDQEGKTLGVDSGSFLVRST